MNVPRQNHTATLLPNGMVLVAGGRSVLTPVPTAEIYEPVSGTWSPAAPMATGRELHRAVLLDHPPCSDLCGKVLVTGGQVVAGVTSSSTVATGSSELFDPLTRTWTTTNSFSPAKSDHTATVLKSGKVLIAGGSSGTTGGGNSTASARLFDPLTRTWSSTGDMGEARQVHTATLLESGQVLVTGGYFQLQSTELYNPVTGQWSPASPMAAGRHSHTASLLQNGKVLVVGGWPTTSTELYGPPLPVVSVGDVGLHEGDSGTRAAVFTVSLSEPSDATVTVAYATADGNAGGSDFTAKLGTLSFAPAATSMTVKVPVAGDTADEADESFAVALSSPVGAVIGDGTGLGTIYDDDPATVTGRRLSVGDVAVHEGDAGARVAVFNVSLSKASASYVTVNFATVKATAIGTDFTAKSGDLSFAPGRTTMNVKVAIAPDDLAEGNETFTVKLSAASGAVIADGTGEGTIVDDD